MKIAKKKVKFQILLVNPIINMERLLKKIPKKDKYMAIKYHDTSGINFSESYEINLPYFGKGSPEEWLDWKDKLLKALNIQGISTGPKRYTFTERLLIGYTKATFY